MGSDIGVVIPSSSKEVRNKKKAEAFLLQMAEHLWKVLRIEGISTSMNDDYCDGLPLKDE